MGFEEQLREVLKRLPPDPTLPKSLVDFTRAGLRHPTLIRLDVDSKLSDKLKLTHLFCRREDKLGILLSILGDRSLIEENSLTLIFCATKHYVEFLHAVLEYFNFKCACLYSSMDSEARRVNVEKFHRKQINILIVTDLAARGVDIPLLDNVINFHFPAKAKLFVHRVGRAARAGRHGHAISFISTDEYAYLLDLYLFLGRSLQFSTSGTCADVGDLIGTVPQRRVDDENRTIALLLNTTNLDLKVAENSYKHYTRSRPTSSAESVRRAKAETRLNNLPNHPAMAAVGFGCEKLEREKDILLANIKCFRPQTVRSRRELFDVNLCTVFELNAKSSDLQWQVMKAKRRVHQKKIDQSKAATVAEMNAASNEEDHPLQQHVDAHANDPVDFTGVFKRATESVLSHKKKKKKTQNQKTTVKEEEKKEQFFIPYVPSDLHSEQGDRKRKKFVNACDEDNKKRSSKKIKTESGVWIPASYKTDLYDSWKKKLRMKAVQAKGRKGVASGGGGRRPVKSELKSKMQIIKQHVESEHRRKRNGKQLTNEKKQKKKKK
ncbi:putative ATP-dependent RNA helicase DDX54 [Trichinella spiralis]|uniref:putative ATP-dependent RNA helicase DDX54 n=1 Tax=Trichinella spiralis TaxID=6334 RepID=UPI0001EFB84A|nr:putative ATP-dependent RNA helicase DDX54 [Trichinella spiralis]